MPEPPNSHGAWLPKPQIRLLAGIVALAAGIFSLDSATPRGVADGAPYVAPVLLAFWLPWRRASVVVAAVCSGLITVGFLVSPTGAEIGLSLGSRALGLLAVWVVAILATRLKSTEQNLVDANRALRALHECNEYLVRAQDEDALTEEVCRIVVESGGYPLAWLGLFEPGRRLPRRFEKTAGYARFQGKAQDVPWAEEIESGPIAAVLRRGEALLKKDILGDPELSAWKADAARKGYRSLFLIPLADREDFLGIVVVGCPKPEGFGLDDRGLLEELAHDLAYGITALRTRVRHARAEKQIHLQTAALESAANSVVITDTAGIIVWVNPAFTRLTGYSPEESIGHPTRILKSGKHDEAFYKDLWDTILAGRVWRGEMANRRKDGSLYIEEQTITPVKDESGQIRNFVAIKQDFTEQKKAEAQLRNSESFLQQSQAVARVGSYVYDVPTGTWINSSVLDEIFGIDESFPKNSDGWVRLLHPDEQTELVRYFQQHVLAEHNPFDKEYRIIRQNDRQERWVHGLGKLEFDADGNLIQMIGTVQDITERRATERELRLTQDAVEHFQDIALWVRPDGKLFYVNERACQALGYSREELLRMSIPDIDPSFPRERFAEIWEQLGEQGTMTFESLHRCKDGSVFPVEITANRLNFHGESYGIAFSRDITERKKLETQFFQAQKMEAVGRLAGGVAHDFNNLLGVILGYGELLLDQQDAAQAQFLEEILKAARHGAALTRQLLAFSRKQVLEPKVLDLNQLITDMLKMLQRLIGEDVALTFAPTPSLGSVKVDPGQIEQVLMNLGINARDAMPNGGKLTIETENVELDRAYFNQHSSGTPGPYVLLAVSDTGTGMDSGTQARIFEPFFTTKEKGKGTGLGLATVYGIVKQSGGYVWVYSEPGHGTTFKVYFPRFAEAGETEESGVVPKITIQGSETILLVEDAEPLRELARLFLEGAGYHVLEANGGAEALEMSRGHGGPIHLLLTDVIMPGMSGAELAAKLRVERPESKIIFMSGYTDDAIAHHGVLDSGVTLLVKPFTRDALIRKVREVLDRQETLRS